MIQRVSYDFDLQLDGGPALQEQGPCAREHVIANHTAIMPSRILRAAYLFQSTITGLPIFIADQLVNCLCMIVACYVVNLNQGHPFNPGVWNQIPAFLILQTVLFGMHQLYPGVGLSPPNEIQGVWRSTSFSLICLSSLNMLLGYLPRIEFAVFVLAGLGVCVLVPVLRTLLRTQLAKTRWWGIRVLLVGSKAQCAAATSELERRASSGYMPAGYTCCADEFDGSAVKDERLLGVNTDAVTIARMELAPVVCIVAPARDLAHPERLFLQFPGVIWMKSLAIGDETIDVTGLPTVIVHGQCLPFLCFTPRLTKRLMDLLIAIPALILLSLPMGVIAVLIKLLSPGPIFYASQRVGQHGKLFRMWKFRTMVTDADTVLKSKLATDSQAAAEWAATKKLKVDPRIIPKVGSLLRRWSLDEMPQLWNVVIGEMSLVGPRPVPEDEIVKYESRYYEYTQMWPGITGLWQVSGRNDTTFQTRTYLVHYYARHWSLWLDAWILIKTPCAVFTKRGAY